MPVGMVEFLNRAKERHMKKQWILPVALVTTMGSTAVYADRNEGFYVGGQLGTPDIDVDIDDLDVDADENESIGLVLGANLGQGWALEFVHTEFDGDLEVNDNDGDFDTDSNAIYGVYRSEGQIYFKGKAGLSYIDTEGKSAAARQSHSDTDLSAGLGVGLDLSPVTIEAEYTYLAEDIDLYTIGVNVHF